MQSPDTKDDFHLKKCWFITKILRSSLKKKKVNKEWNTLSINAAYEKQIFFIIK